MKRLCGTHWFHKDPDASGSRWHDLRLSTIRLREDMGVTKKDNRVFAGYAGMTLFIGDAHRAATAEQRNVLRETLGPLLVEFGDHSTSPARVDQLVKMISEETVRIMGSGWELSTEANAVIGALLR